MLFSPDNIIRLHAVGSTNDYMIEQIRNGNINLEGTIVIADEQTSGKGMDLNIWESEPGKNLTFSIFFKPDFLRADQQFLLNKSISLGVYDFIKSLVIHQKVTIKWPNDIYVGDKKIAGILINNTIAGNELLYSVAGIGVNINQQKFPGHVRNPISLLHALRKELDLKQVLHELLYWLENRYDQLLRGEYVQINDSYLESLYRLNELHFYRLKNKGLSARITGVSDFGHLQLTLDDNQSLECDFKEVEFII